MRDRAGIYAFAGAAVFTGILLAAARVGEEPGALSNWQALILGLVQGLTELLPISSSAHLILVPWVADWEYLVENDRFNQTFDVALHIGTLIAVIAYFRGELIALLGALVRVVRRRRAETPLERISLYVAIATVPAAIVGALGEDLIADNLGEPWQIAILLAVFGVLLWVADRRPQERGMGDLDTRGAVKIGLAQALALMPGVSRSGITITAGRFLGLDRDAAARFSFLLLVPTTAGAVLWKGLNDVVLGDLPPGTTGPFIVGTLASAASGFVAIVGLLSYVRRHDYTIFVIYRLILAAIVLLLIATGVRSAEF